MRIKRRQTITEEYSPTFRRRINSKYLSLSLKGQLLMQDQSNQQQSPVTAGIEEQKEIDLFNRRHRVSGNAHHVERANMYLENFIKNNTKIHKIIDQVDQIIRKRMEAHQQGLLSVVKSQIDKMQVQCKQIVQQYNKMLQTKNKQSQIYSLKNELDYFRSEALIHFQNYNKIKQQNKSLRALVKNKDSIIEDLNLTIKRMTKKYLRGKAILTRIEKQEEYHRINNTGNDYICTIQQQEEKDQEKKNKIDIFMDTVKNMSGFSVRQPTDKDKNYSKMQGNYGEKEFQNQKKPRYHTFYKYRMQNNSKQKTQVSCIQTSQQDKLKFKVVQNSKQSSLDKQQYKGNQKRDQKVKTTFSKFWSSQKDKNYNQKRDSITNREKIQNFKLKKRIYTEANYPNRNSLGLKQKEVSSFQMAKIKILDKTKSVQKLIQKN